MQNRVFENIFCCQTDCFYALRSIYCYATSVKYNLYIQQNIKSWKECQKIMANLKEFITKSVEIGKEPGKISPTTIEKAKAALPDTSYEEVMKISAACASIFSWVTFLYEIF